MTSMKIENVSIRKECRRYEMFIEEMRSRFHTLPNWAKFGR